MPLPTFVIAGAQKCGTSSLRATLRRHPQVFTARPKELHFFDRHFDRGLDWYSDQFTPLPRNLQFGEATPAYLHDEAARRRMAQSLPEARFVVILRDPVKRAYSHFWHAKRLGFEEAETTFEEALALEPARLATGQRADLRRFSYVDRGQYVDQIQSLEGYAAASRIHTLLLEDLIADRVPTLQRLFEFLTIDTDFAASIEAQWTNRYRTAASPEEKAVPVAYPPMAGDVRARLVEHFRPYNDRLAEHLGRDLSAWNKV